MTSIEHQWNTLEAARDYGGSRRVDETLQHDFYLSLDSDGRRGLLLVTPTEPPDAPVFEAVDVITSRRADGQWVLSIWLRASQLSGVFAELCQNLIESCAEVTFESLPTFVLSRLLSWQQLLARGDLGLMSAQAIRALIGELLVLQRCLNLWRPLDVIAGWVGPAHAPQDILLPELTIEVKTILPSAKTVQINSVDQLDVPSGERLLLATCTLASAASSDPPHFSLPTLASEIRTALGPEPAAVDEFDSKLASAGYYANENYEKHNFRFAGMHFYRVSDAFPRILRDQLPHGVLDATYKVGIALCTPHETTLEI